MSDMIYGLNDKPPAGQAFFAGLQHLMAIFVGIVTPPIIITGALGLDVKQSSFIISMALFASGISTFIQVKKIGPIGSGLLSIQGTSFVFLGSIIAAGLAVKAGGGTGEAALATIFAVCFLGSFVEMIFSRFIPLLKKIITPLVSGIVVTLIGLSLIRVGIIDVAGGAYVMANVPDAFASLQNLGLAAIVLVVIIVLNRSKNNSVRMSAIFSGLVVGYIVAVILGKVNFGRLADVAIIQAPIPFRYGFSGINWGVLAGSLIPFMLLYLITTVESIGDLTATSMVSGEPIEGELYMKRISGGVLGDGVNSAIAAIFNSFPNTTFSQNNGVIQMTGVASRYVGFWIAGMLVVVGLFPIVGGIFSIIPPSVLGGATIIMFGTVAAAGIRIIASSTIDRRGVLIMAISFGLGLGVVFVPDVIKNFSPVMKSIFGSAVTTGGLTAIALNIILPRSLRKQKVGNPPSTGFEDVN